MPEHSEEATMDVVNEKLNNHGKAEQKRMKSIIEMKKSYQKQKDTIKAALANVDSKINKVTKIVFQDDENEDGFDYNIEATEKPEKHDKQDSKLSVIAKTIFEDDGDSDGFEYNFEVKEHFQGKQGRKLMELQSKFKNDKRFAMDKRFLDDGNEEKIEEDFEENKTFEYKKEADAIEITKEEKDAELSILEDVLGKKFVKRDTDPQDIQTMRRFDPTKVGKSKSTLKVNEPLKEKKKKRKKSEDPDIVEDDQTAKRPLVSKETFYTVTENLKETFKQNEPFSFINMFDSNKDPNETQIENVENEITNDKPISNGHSWTNGQRNPFQYDSSDASDTEQLDATEMQKENVAEDEKNAQNVSLDVTQSWREPFFFRDDDYRFQEGIDFVRKFKEDDNTEFEQVRRTIKKIVRAKVRNNQRKNKPFRTKLGGRKMMKMKRAMKNN